MNFCWIDETFIFENKKKVPLLIKSEAEFYFINSPKEIDDEYDSYTVVLNDDIVSEQDLLDIYYKKLNFPSYFGFNWDALNDCFRYLDEIEEKYIIIYHRKLPVLNDKNTKIYLEILRDTISFWKKHEEHDFKVFFDLENFNRLKELCSCWA